MHFHLSTLFWVIFVFAASMSFAGVWGIPLAIYWVVQLWLAAGKARKYGARQAVAEMLAVSAVLALVLWCLIPQNASIPAARQSQCSNTLHQIGLGLENYRTQWRRFPPALVYDSSGRPLHSWRTLILPYMEQASLHAACDMRVPWNEGVNSPLLGNRLSVYACPSDIDWKDKKNVHTSYVAIVGPGTFWDPAATPPPKDTRIVAVEMAKSGIAWAEPKDLALAGLFAAENEEDMPNTFPRSMHRSGFLVLLADGSVRRIPWMSSRRLLEVGLTQGLDVAQAEEKKAPRPFEPLWQRWQQRLEEADRRTHFLTALAFVVWVVSVVGFGVHAFRVRRSTANDAAEVPSPPADDSKP